MRRFSQKDWFKIILSTAAWLPLPLVAQTITAKLMGNPIRMDGYVPLSLGGGVEIGISPKSSMQLVGMYRVDKQLGESLDQGPKFYFDYRYYLNPPQRKNSGLYLSPFVGYGKLRLTGLDSPSGTQTDDTRRETLAGLLIGYQPYKKKSWLSVDMYAGPEYQWNVWSFANQNAPPSRYYSNRLWFRAGMSLSVRLKE